MNQIAPIGHNGHDPIADCAALYDDIISEAQNWADGEPVTDEASCLAVDEIIKGFKTYRTALTKAGKERTDPPHKVWKAEVAAVKVYTDDADRLQSCLVALVGPFKQEQAAKKESERKAAWEAARKAEREAAELAAKADAGNIDDQRAADAAKQAQIDAQKAASVAQKDTVKGMRTVTHHEVVDMGLLINWIARNDKEAIAAFATEYARKNHAAIPDDTVRTWTTKEAF